MSISMGGHRHSPRGRAERGDATAARRLAWRALVVKVRSDAEHAADRVKAIHLQVAQILRAGPQCGACDERLGLDALLAGTAAADELGARLGVEKERKAALAAELEALKGGRREPTSPNSTKGGSWRRYGTRQILRKPLVGRLECRAFDEGNRVGYRFAARGSYAELMAREPFNA